MSASSHSPLTPSAGPEAAPPAGEVVASAADFTEVRPGHRAADPSPLDNLLSVRMTVTVELGRVSMTIDEILRLAPGSVVELNREVSEPVDIVAQGVRIARGEVVVLGDRFAVRVTEITKEKQRLADS